MRSSLARYVSMLGGILLLWSVANVFNGQVWLFKFRGIFSSRLDDEIFSSKLDETFNRPKEVGMVYTGDNSQWMVPLGKSLFPDAAGHTHMQNWSAPEFQTINFTQDDILFIGYNPCRIRNNELKVAASRGYPGQRIMSFPGTVLWFCNEPRSVHTKCGRTNPLPPAHLMIGPYHKGSKMNRLVDLSHTELVFFAPAYLWSFPPDIRSMFLDPSLTIQSWRQERQKSKVPLNKSMANNRDRFAVYVATHCVGFREKAVARISHEIGSVHAGGPCNAKGTADDYSGEARARQFFWSLPHFFQKYRFAIVFENVMEDGYITEKIVNAYLGGAIPVYYGTTDVFSIFSRDSFVYYNMSDPDPALALLRHLESNESAYKEMISRPIFANGSDTFEKYFSFDNSIGGGKMKQRIHDMVFAAKVRSSKKARRQRIRKGISQNLVVKKPLKQRIRKSEGIAIRKEPLAKKKKGAKKITPMRKEPLAKKKKGTKKKIIPTRKEPLAKKKNGAKKKIRKKSSSLVV
jgi:hypothetical protein